MKLLDKKDVFEQRRLEEQNMVIRGSRISDLVQTHQGKLNEAKQEFISEIEKQKALFDEMVGHYTEKISTLKGEVATLVHQRDTALHPLFIQEEKLKTIQEDISKREFKIKEDLLKIQQDEEKIKQTKKILKTQTQDAQDFMDNATLNFLNSQKKLDEIETINKQAAEDYKKITDFVKKITNELEAQKVASDARQEVLDTEEKLLVARKTALTNREKFINDKEKQVNDRYKSLLKAEEYTKLKKQ